MPTGDPRLFQHQRDQYVASLVSGVVQTYQPEGSNKYISSIALELIKNIPEVLDSQNTQVLTAYQLGISNLAEALTGQSIFNEDLTQLKQ